jgi:class 3 adenylate cyclase
MVIKMNETNLSSRLNAIRATDTFEAQVIEQFAEFVVTAPDEELFHMSPLRYAEQAHLSKETAVDLFLYATHAGILDFNWGLLCPSCGAFLTKKSGLRWLHTQKHCSLCQLDTTPSLDDQIEIAFTVSPAVRGIRFHNLEELEFERDGFFTFFSTSVALHPEIHQIVYSSVQAGYRIPAVSTHEISLTFEPDHYMLMVPTTHAVAHIPVNEGQAAREVEFELLFDGQLVPEIQPLGPGDGLIRIHNRTRQAAPLGLLRDHRMAPTPPEQRSGSLYSLTPFLTAKELINTQTFRDLFRMESIPPAGGLQIKNLTLLFTDLKGSTALYDRIGDFNAYALVREHFALLRGIVAARHGAIVKTMGDAIMASFSDPASALEAAAVMRRETQKASSGEQLILKIGLHSGPCVAVETNEQLDYFGQTVNLASRVQAVAAAGEIVCTEAVYHAPHIPEVIQKAGLHSTKDQALLKGVGNPVIFYRLA